MEMIVGGLLIFLARVINVSMGTVLTLLGMRGQKRWATAADSPPAPGSGWSSRRSWPWATLS